MKVDLHVHTRYSIDSLATLPDVLRWAERRGMGALAITDHDTIEGARALRQISPIPIIVGEEISTSRGEIIGLFLQEAVPPGLSPESTIGLVHQQGGLVYLPHPIDRARRNRLEFDSLLDVIEQADLIEVLNARVTFSLDNRLAEALARAYGLPHGAGSDAHQGFEIGRAYVEMPLFHDASSFKRSLSRSDVRGHISSPLVHVGSTYAKVAKGIMAFAPFAK